MVSIANHVDDPIKLLEYVLNKAFEDNAISIMSALVLNIISGARKADREKALECLGLALNVQRLESLSIEFIAAVGVDDALMERAIKLIQGDKVEARSALALAFNDILEHVDHRLIKGVIEAVQKKDEDGAWVAITFLSRILHRKGLGDSVLFDSIVTSVINPHLFSSSQCSTMDWYYLCELVEKVLESGRADDKFISDMVDFIISVTTVEDFIVQLKFDDYAQKVLRRSIVKSPRLIWEKYHEAIGKDGDIASYRLSTLFESDRGNPSRPGVLNDVPQDIYVPWMLQEKEERLPFILDWIQVFSLESNDSNWSPDFISFVDAYVDRPDRLDVLRKRLTTGAWVGSLAGKLESERDKLLELRELSKNTHVHQWIDRIVSEFEREISEQHRRDANREASYKA
ncbi:MAG: hypothetical protein HUJ16_07475 [Kangiella sp.]|nr:hypothetical protein [Kangiella sp.]